MATTTRGVRAQTSASRSTLRARPWRWRRLRSVVSEVEAHVVGRGRPLTPVAPGAPPDVGRPLQTGPAPGALVRPVPLDKPAVLAHYQALADQVAYERRLSDLRLGPVPPPPAPRPLLRPPVRCSGGRDG